MFEFENVIRVQCSIMRSQSLPDVLSKYFTMVMTTTAARLCSLNVWNGAVLDLDEQLVRLQH